jgi:hypothetical protein
MSEKSAFTESIPRLQASARVNLRSVSEDEKLAGD